MVENKSMHAIGQMIASRDAEIRSLKKQLAEAKIGGQPASQLRDAVLPVIEHARDVLKAGDMRKLENALTSLAGHLKTIPSLEPPSDKMVEETGLKPYAPLDHGKPER